MHLSRRDRDHVATRCVAARACVRAFVVPARTATPPVTSSECSRTSSRGRARPATTAPATLRSSPFSSSPSGFSRLGLLGPYPVLSRATDVPCPSRSLVNNSTAVKCSAAKPAFVEKVEKAGKAAFGGLAALTLAAGVRYSIKSFPRLVQPYPRHSGRAWSANASNRHGTTAIGPARVSTRGAGTANASHPPVRGVFRPRSSGFFLVLTTRVPRSRGHDLQNQQ